MIFSGIDTTICVETSLCDVFNLGCDIVLIASATISSNKKYYEATIDNIKDYYGSSYRFRLIQPIPTYLSIKQVSSISIIRPGYSELYAIITSH